MVVKRFAIPLVLAYALAGCGAAGGTPTVAAPLASALPGVSPQATLRTGPVGDDGATASCVESYSAATIGNRAFAFDGTVVDTGAGRTNRRDRDSPDTTAVTFHVNEWFEGGTDTTVTVDMMPPTSSISSDEPPAYEEGTRLLVSGEPRWGGAPLADAIAWSCGFTRYYEAGLADEWRAATA